VRIFIQNNAAVVTNLDTLEQDTGEATRVLLKGWDSR